MKSRGVLYLSTFIAFIMLTSLACSLFTSAPTAVPIPPTNPPVNNQPTNNSPANNPSSNNATSTQAPQQSSGGLVTFTDKNKLYEIQVPSDWTHKTSSGQYYYIDQFKSSDGNALVENIAYNDGTPFTGSQNGQFALQLLNQFYSNTGKTGDIHVTVDKIENDGSEHLAWYSKGGAYSGESFFEIRGSDSGTFLMFTIEWSDSAKDQYYDTLSNVVSSYTTP